MSSLPVIAASTTLAETRSANPGAAIDYELFLDCIHCGLCTSACPTYLVTGDENNGPRGRIHLMRAVTDERLPLTSEVRNHLDLCLDCRACETACPSGVQYGRLIEPFRVAMAQSVAEGTAITEPAHDWFTRTILLGLMPYPERLRRALIPARWAQRFGLLTFAERMGLLKLLPRRLRQLVQTLPPQSKSLPALPAILPAVGRRRARVALFTGCVNDVMFRATNWSTARVLHQNGCDVIVPAGQVCCGAIHYHAGSSEPARAFANINAQVFKPDEVDAVIVNVAGCGAMLKDYPHHWDDAQAPARQEFAAKVRDVHEFLDDLGPVPPTRQLKLVATYHDACHLGHAQKIRAAPRRLLQMIPGLELRELTETDICCGAAGTYNLTQPEMAGILSRRKLDHILATGATTVITANAGCLLQIQREAQLRGERLTVVHPMDLLDQSYQE